MWGAQRYKTPANFTRDTTRPHIGAACFRIHHPADTAGYVVSAPAQAIRPRKGKMYIVTFHARAAHPGHAVFGITAYRTINPFVDAHNPGHVTFPVTTDWKPYRFEYHEGWDFFADDCRHMLLTFKATRNRREAQTLWIDDVVVTEQRSPRRGRLANVATLAHEPLRHRLSPGGPGLAITIDAARRRHRVPRDIGGVSFHRVAGWTGQPYNKKGDYTLHPAVEQAILLMRLPMTRFYAVGDEPFGLEAAIDKAAEVVGRVGVPQDHTVLEFEVQGSMRSLAPEVWARGVRHALARGYAFKHWEIANEPYVPHSPMAYPEPDDYIRHFKAVSAAIRTVHPAGHIGLAIHANSHRWGNYVLKQAAGHYDFVVGHYYSGGRVHNEPFEHVVLTRNFDTLTRILQTNALIRAYNPRRPVYQYDTEWGLHSAGPNGERADYVDRNANIYGTLHRAVRLIYYAREPLLRGASSWQMFSRLRAQGFGVLSQQAPTKRFLIYWLYYHFNRHLGDWVLDTQGTAPYYTPPDGGLAGPLTPAVATLSDDGRTLYLVLVNGSWTRPVPCNIQLRSFAPAAAHAIVLSHPDPDGKPLLDRKEDAIATLPTTLAGSKLTCMLPPHSAVFITLSRSPR